MTTRTDLVVTLLVPGAPSCAPCQDAIEQLDRAAALLAPELIAREARMRVRVVPRARDSGRPMELRIDGVPLRPRGGRVRWDPGTCEAPPAELLVSAVHDHLDRIERAWDRGVLRSAVTSARTPRALVTETSHSAVRF